MNANDLDLISHLINPTEHDLIQVNAALPWIKNINWNKFQLIADIGAGPGHHASIISKLGGNVICIDYKKPVYKNLQWNSPDSYLDQVDCIWSHHCLEHIRDPIGALIKWQSILRRGGSLYLTVPQVDYVMSDGHINAYTLPLLMYHLALSGFDCSGKQFCRERSHLRASVVKCHNYDPKISGPINSMQKLAILKLFPPSVVDAILKRGRFDASDMHLSWGGIQAKPKIDCLQAVNFVSHSIWEKSSLDAE